MGGNSQSRPMCNRLPTTNGGFMGRRRHVQPWQRRYEVYEINGRKIGKLITQLCGNEGYHEHLNDNERITLRFLQAANSFIHDAENDGANLKNTAFILRQPGREIVIIAGNGDWEYDFCQESDGQIYGRSIRRPWLRYVYDGVRGIATRIGSALLGLPSKAPIWALTW